SNDDAPNDVLYVNNRDGTFTDKAGAYLKHASFAGMGLDIADVNNDGWPDIMQTDMMPADPGDRKRMSGAMNYGGIVQLRNRGFRDDYQVNTFQLSNGVTPSGDVVFSEIAHQAGVAYTNWSWSALFADFDNDGRKDLFVTNGYPKAGNDYDYQMGMYRLKHGGLDPQVGHDRGVELLRQLRGYHLPNYMFRNNGDLTFSDETKAWGMEQPSFSYGAAYVDLDNDGKLDLVVNNIDDPAFIYRNVAPQDSAHHWLAVQLQGDGPNRNGIGATLILSAGGERQYIYHSPYRGYMSTMDDRAHFGLGREARADSLQVIWPDGRYQLLTDVAADRFVTVRQEVASGRWPVAGCIPCRPLTTDHAFQPMDSRRAPKYLHKTSTLNDYDVQPLLPYMPSRQGPPLAVGDVNGDSLSDVYIGGGAGVPGKLFVQQRDGSFVESARGQPWAADTAFDDWGALFFDAGGNGRPDLFVASCGYRLSPVSRQLQSRFYRNVGAGRFVRDTLALPTMQTCTSAVAAADFNGDGKPDLFVGGRLVPRNYPAPTRSYLLRNEGGRFVDATDLWAPELDKPGGMITAAVWVDFDGDGKPDLVTAGEWMPIEFWHNDGNRLRNVTAAMGLPPTRGWWYSLAVGDFNHDGRPDLVAGNLGLNATYVTSPQNHFGVYAGDFSAPRSADIVLTEEEGGNDAPFYGLARYGPVIYQLALRFPTYAEFSRMSMAELFGAAQLQKAIHYQTDTFASLYLQNNGNGTFSASPLPNLAQIAPIRGIVATDVDGDGNLDLVVAGNLWEMEPNTPRVDAGNGLWLKGDGKGHFTPVPPVASGFLAPGHVTGLALVRTPAGDAVLVANNGDSLQAFAIVRR
ncbi:MAG TPA: VCBS repeat-containing protein, partial [Gemmatimonadales bacterium]|nr:VCBS repeat-containing protein [Gemmatimonadales bacterium]